MIGDVSRFWTACGRRDPGDKSWNEATFTIHISGMHYEVETVRAMIGIYCRAHHGANAALCADCEELRAYAEARIAKCPFGIDKPVCNQCTVHCYQPAMREDIQRIMRYAGPRMPARHPLLAIRHLLRSRRYNSGRSK